MRARILVMLSAFMFLCSSAASAQSADKSHFGVSVNFNPSAAVPADSFAKAAFKVDATGEKFSGFEVGVVRGRDLGGDWGAEVVYRKMSGGEFTSHFGTTCIMGCFQIGSRYLVTDASLLGFTVHKYVPFVTIARRAQIGLAFAGGVASVRASVERHDYDYEFVTVGGRSVMKQTETVTKVDASEIFRSKTIPIGKLEIAAAAILAPGLKLRVGWGMNFPSYPSLTVGVSYLIGAK